jgi:hypothetical protein
MAMRFKAILALAGGAALAAGCAPVDPGFGEALRYDMAVQTVDPDPQYPEDSAKPGANGEHGQKAVERYRKGQSKSLRIERSNSGGGSGGGGGGSN